MKPKLFKKTNLYGNVYWVCKSNTHEAYGTTPEEAYQFWEAMKELQKNRFGKEQTVAHDYYEAIGWQPYSALKHVPIAYSDNTKM